MAAGTALSARASFAPKPANIDWLRSMAARASAKRPTWAYSTHSGLSRSASAQRSPLASCKQLLGAGDRGISRDGQQGEGHGQPVAGPHLRAVIAAVPRAGDGALENWLTGWYVTEPEPQPAGRGQRLGQSVQVTVGFQDRRRRLAFRQRFGVSQALQVPDVSAQDRGSGPAPRRAPAAAATSEPSASTASAPLQVTGLEQHRAEQPQQVRPQAQIGWALGERAVQPVPSLLQQPAAEPEVPERPGEPRPGLAAVRQGPFQRGAEVVLLAHQHRQPAFPLGQAQERGRVPVPGGLGAAGLGEPVRRVVAHRVQQPVAGPVLGRLGGHQRLARQPVDHLPAPSSWSPPHTSATCASPKVPANTDSSPRTRRSAADSRS